ncbi:ArsR/SmtB family transcription factor [Rhizobium halophytocola]|uniref:DNA-binding transcriptional ArsR family regulator n=1 Tax=Rhizobium halophytocola TaxID=735519 RepID=A0ABS4E6B0_9HYPH|nr:metalloregulator ArsR/SmtB family transcription factor [Rhizobium halophytocola]MBP1853485.1 DNA-binding transcriptional ArsR family regulator [Rhizobium halophytocola]
MPNYNTPLDQLFHALADPGRRAMVDRLAKGPASVKALAEPLAMSLPAVMQHLSVLEKAGLVASQKQGRIRTCSLRPEALSQAEAWLNARRLGWVNRFDRLAAMLDEEDRTGEPRE